MKSIAVLTTNICGVVVEIPVQGNIENRGLLPTESVHRDFVVGAQQQAFEYYEQLHRNRLQEQQFEALVPTYQAIGGQETRSESMRHGGRQHLEVFSREQRRHEGGTHQHQQDIFTAGSFLENASAGLQQPAFKNYSQFHQPQGYRGPPNYENGTDWNSHLRRLDTSPIPLQARPAIPVNEPFQGE